MSEPSLDELMFLYVSGVLDGEEREILEQRLASGEGAARESMTRAEALLMKLPLALEPRLPDAQVRERLLARVRADAEAPASSGVEAISARRGGGDRLGWWAAAAAILVGLALGAMGWRMQRVGDEARLALSRAEAAARDRAAGAEARLVALEGERDEARALGAGLRAELARLSAEVTALTARAGLLERDRDALADQLGDARGRANSAEARALALAAEVESLSNQLAARSIVPPEGPATRQVRRVEEAPAAGSSEATDAGLATATLRQALALVRAPDSALIELVAEDSGGRGSASVFWDRGLRHCYVHARSLAPSAPGSTYALWVEYATGRQVRITDFRLEAGERDVERFADLPVGLGEIARTWVTAEAMGGGASPEGPTVLRERRPEKTTSEDGEPSRRYRRRAF